MNSEVLRMYSPNPAEPGKDLVLALFPNVSGRKDVAASIRRSLLKSTWPAKEFGLMMHQLKQIYPVLKQEPMTVLAATLDQYLNSLKDQPVKLSALDGANLM